MAEVVAVGATDEGAARPKSQFMSQTKPKKPKSKARSKRGRCAGQAAVFDRGEVAVKAKAKGIVVSAETESLLRHWQGPSQSRRSHRLSQGYGLRPSLSIVAVEEAKGTA